MQAHCIYRCGFSLAKSLIHFSIGIFYHEASYCISFCYQNLILYYYCYYYYYYKLESGGIAQVCSHEKSFFIYSSLGHSWLNLRLCHFLPSFISAGRPSSVRGVVIIELFQPHLQLSSAMFDSSLTLFMMQDTRSVSNFYMSCVTVIFSQFLQQWHESTGLSSRLNLDQT